MDPRSRANRLLLDEARLQEACVRLGDRRARNLVLQDLESLKECLVEEPPLDRTGVVVGGLDVSGEVERLVEGRPDLVVTDVQLFKRLVRGATISLDLLELAVVHVFGDLAGVMTLKELVLPLIEPVEFLGSSGYLALCYLGKAVEALVQNTTDPFALLVRELNVGVVADDRLFDRLNLVVALTTGLDLPSSADEVVVCGPVASDVTREHQPTSTFTAVDRPLEVVVVDAFALTGQPLRFKLVLDPLEQRQGDEWLMPAWVRVAAIVHDTDVVVVAEHVVEPVGSERLCLRSWRWSCS